MPMTLEQLIKLYILQKDSHRYIQGFEGETARANFKVEYELLMTDVDYVSSDMMAPSLFNNQPQIPFVIFKPVTASEQNPAPLIIHTHGGPNVYMNKNNLHAEIAYWISHGFTVVCPNYRGSTGYPAIGDNYDEWRTWEKRAKDKYHIYGPQDVYAVTKCVMGMPFIAQDKIFLRGGSFGSFINAHLLAGVKQGLYENIFKAAHFSGGENYPAPLSMPDDIPLLITHARKDKIASFDDAQLFMEKMLLKQLAVELEGIEVNNLQTFVSTTGDHHLINPTLKLEDTKSESYKELVTYLDHSTKFIHTLVEGNKYQPIDSFDQYKKLLADMDIEREDNIEFEIFRQIYAYQISHQLTQQNIAEEYPLQETRQTPERIAGPTCSLLKLQLGDEYSGDIKTDFRRFLVSHFKPIDWSTGEKLIYAGEEILSDECFFEQIVQLIEHEESFLQKHPNHMVMSHAAEPNVLQLYTFINLWYGILVNQPINTLQTLKEMRLYEFMKNTFDDINVFLLKMRQLKTIIPTEKLFNNLPGFAERAIACGPSLISNAHSTAACPLWWYFKAKKNKRAPIETVISDLLVMLGIHSEERVNRYLKLFQRELKRLPKEPQALLQQLFVPYEIADDSAYMCQIWGEEFKANNIQLHTPSIIKELIADPVAFEKKLRDNKDVYTNFGDCEGFGDVTQGFNYANCLQLRNLLRNHKDIYTMSYLRSPKAHDDFVTALGKLVQEDYADFLAYGNPVPNFIIPGAEETKQTLISTTKLGIFKAEEQINIYAFIRQQQELYKGLVQNPTKELYGDIIAIPKETKRKLQNQLRKMNDGESKHAVFPFSLCIYLKGYTYYDLLKEAAEATFFNDKILPECRERAKQSYESLMKMIDLFSIPASVKRVELCGEEYQRFYTMLQSRLGKYAYNSNKHQFIKPEAGECYPDYLFELELKNAINCVLKFAKLAKERGYGHDVEPDLEHIYCS